MSASTGSVPTASQSYGGALKAQLKYAPEIYAQNAEYSPLYTSLDLSNLSDFLNGTNGNNGFLSQYENNIMPALTSAQTKANSAIRQGNLNDAQALIPSWTAATRAANPGAAGLLDQLSGTASKELSYGTQLTPAEQLQLNQSVRSGQAARGMGMGPSDVFNESLADTNMGQQLLQQREGQAGSVAGQLQTFYGNPVEAISGMGSNAGMSAGQLASFGGGSVAPTQSSEFNPTQMAESFGGLQTQTGLQNAQMQNQLTESEMSNATKMGSSMMGSL